MTQGFQQPFACLIVRETSAISEPPGIHSHIVFVQWKKAFNYDVFRHASVSSTYPCKLVGKLVGKSHFRISNLWSVMVAQIKKFKKLSPFIFEFCF